jgi:hypothetical protein
MKKILLAIAIALFALPKINAQENVIKFNPLALVLSTVQVGYERVLNDNQSIQVNLGYASFKSGSIDYSGFGGGLQYRFYLQKEKVALEGWFAAPYVNYSSYDASGLKTSIFSGGGLVGYQWLWNPITLDLYIGPAYYSVNADEDSFDYGFEGFGPIFGFSLGYSF